MSETKIYLSGSQQKINRNVLIHIILKSPALRGRCVSVSE